LGFVVPENKKKTHLLNTAYSCLTCSASVSEWSYSTMAFYKYIIIIIIIIIIIVIFYFLPSVHV